MHELQLNLRHEKKKARFRTALSDMFDFQSADDDPNKVLDAEYYACYNHTLYIIIDDIL